MDTGGWDDFIVAVETADDETLEFILENISEDLLNMRDVRGYCALHYACSAGHTKIVSMLLAKGADPCNMGELQSPLHCACNGGFYDIVQMLLKHGADKAIDAVTKERNITPLMCAAHSVAPSTPRVVAELIKHGADVHLADTEGNTALLFATQTGRFPDVVQGLLDAGADPTCCDHGSVTALHYACASGNEHIVKQLLDLHIPVNSPVGDGQPLTPLYLAVKANNPRLCRMLLEAGADPDVGTASGRRPIHVATYNGRGDIVRLLVAKGAAVNTMDDVGVTALGMAALRGMLPIVHLLLSLGAEPNLPMERDGWTPLLGAARAGRLDVIRTLIKDDRVEVSATDRKARTPLHWAAFRGNKHMIHALLDAGANPRIQDTAGRSPAAVATAQQHVEMAMLLHEKAGTVPNVGKKKLSPDDLHSYWVPDKAVKRCMGCRRKFTTLARRHHCRLCAGVFCNECTSAKLPEAHGLSSYRVCKTCCKREIVALVPTTAPDELPFIKVADEGTQDTDHDVQDPFESHFESEVGLVKGGKKGGKTKGRKDHIFTDQGEFGDDLWTGQDNPEVHDELHGDL
eukprot:m.488280 g.488280  ORF g.488280 m.488280 type:complete len:573 (-) comp25690_c0_seq1:192-1910(-)